jgi:hypothetical protein
MVFFKITDPVILSGPLQAHLNSLNIKTDLVPNGISRFVIQHYIREEQVDRIISAFKQHR